MCTDPALPSHCYIPCESQTHLFVHTCFLGHTQNQLYSWRMIFQFNTLEKKVPVLYHLRSVKNLSVMLSWFLNVD